ncbi:hypothetical protein WKI65_32730 [Streptomyces sp. MS1.AVA.3]|uniref:hypothetical protein n=1 Tax=Streptomyces decoyicus TaxID=249567 RepID=UPI0030BAF0AF
MDVSIRHRRRVHDGGQDAPARSSCDTAECPACTVEDVTVGSMAFYRVHLDRGRNAYWAMEEESEDLYETAQVLLDQQTGSFSEEVSEMLEYIGTDLLVMDRVTLDRQWRGHGLAVILATEAIHRLMPGCRAIACAPGITDLSSHRLKDRTEWDRVTAKIAQGWERIGFRLYRDGIYLLSPASQALEEQRGELRGRLVELGASWRAATS